MQRVRLYSQVAVAATIFVALVVLLGCSPQHRYKVLAFFFDGVPAPGGPQVSAVTGQPIGYTHKPYAEGKCGSCHPSDQVEMSIGRPTNITEISSKVCLTCHEKVTTEYRFMHGPVASTQCLLCHNPHQSMVAHLLNAPAPRLCVQCHGPETMVPRRPEHQDEKADCLSCHVGHGSASHGLLRSAAPPTTRPAAAAAPTPQAAPLPDAAPAPSAAPLERRAAL